MLRCLRACCVCPPPACVPPPYQAAKLPSLMVIKKYLAICVGFGLIFCGTPTQKFRGSSGVENEKMFSRCGIVLPLPIKPLGERGLSCVLCSHFILKIKDRFLLVSVFKRS